MACRFFSESRLADTPAGYRSDFCNLQARMNQKVPIDPNPDLYRLPDGLCLDGTFRPHRR